MVRVRAINRNEESCSKECSQDVSRVQRNMDPQEHPLERAKEYQRALNAVKLRKVFAKPFVRALEHEDGVTCLGRSPVRVNCLVAGAADGEAKVWDVAEGRCLRVLGGHKGAVRAVAVSQDGEVCVTASQDGTARLWRVPFAPPKPGPLGGEWGGDEDEDEGEGGSGSGFRSSGSAAKGRLRGPEAAPAAEYAASGALRGADHHWTRPRFATCGAEVLLWDHERSEPVSRYSWGADTVASVRFNPAEPDLLAGAGSDRSITLYDVRASNAPLRKIVMQTKPSCLSWNPQEAFHLTAGNDDGRLYTHDLRQLAKPRAIHEGFVSAVTDVDWAPTGVEFVAAGYDRSLRIFRKDAPHARDVYTTKRMQRVAATRFSADATYVFSGSDDMNVRVWKADASAKLGVLLPREKKSLAYADALVKRHAHLPEMRRILGHKHLPAPLYRAEKKRQIQIDADRKKEKNVKDHAPKDAPEEKPYKERRVIAELE